MLFSPAKDPKTRLTRRAFVLGGMQGVLTSVLLGRLYWLQVESTDHYKTLSDKNRIHSDVILPIRGQLLDQRGIVLAGNTFAYRALLQRDHAKEWMETLEKIAQILDLSTEAMEDILTFVKKNPRHLPIPIKDKLSWEEVTALELHHNDLPGVRLEQGQQRTYPLGEEFCHILGYVGKITEKERDDYRQKNQQDLSSPVFQHPGFRLGKNGVEKLMEQQLQGQAGLKQVEVNATRHIIRELSTCPPHNGDTIKLSLHASLQKATLDRLKPFESACAVLMHIPTGGILSAVSHPGFDPNHFVNGIDHKEWNRLRSHPHTPLLNKFAQGLYAPGSTFKMIPALAALESGAITPKTTFFCPGHMDIGNHRFHCYLKGGHGHVNLQQAIARSCDVYFYQMALLTGIEKIAHTAHMFGLGDVTALAFPGEKCGIMPDKAWKEHNHHASWRPSDTINTSIGQGYVLSTPLQLCVMTARFASKGLCVHPSFTLSPSPSFNELHVDPQHMDVIFRGMRDVMSDPQGTAYGARSPFPEMEFAGKTGTSQVRRITLLDRKLGLHKHWPWKWRDHALFVGFAPVHAPLYAVCVVIEHGGSGGKIAGPIGRDLLADAITLVGRA